MKRLYKDIADFVFISDNPQPADIIFVPGGSYPETSERAAQLYSQGFAPLIMPSGRFSVHNGKFMGALSKKEIYPFECDTEWQFMQRVLIKNGVPKTAILKEDKALSTYDNARFSKKELDALGIIIKKAIICCKSIHARRALMYYQYYFENAEIFICPVDIANISKKNFTQTPLGIAIVMQEIEKCGTQFSKMLLDKEFPNAENIDLMKLF